MGSLNYYCRNTEYYISKSAKKHNSINLSLLVEDTVNTLKNMYLKQNDILLFNLLSKDTVSQEEFNEFINKWDIEVQGGQKALMLSYFMKTNPMLDYPPYIKPRLDGLLNYYRFKNIKLEAEFKKICSVLKNNDIEILIIKGGAIKHLRHDLPRIMGDIDILIHNYDFKKAINIVKSLGYSYEDYGHSIDLHKGNSQEGILDIHNKINMLSEYADKVNNDFFKRAKYETVFGVDNILVPSYEDMVFMSVINLSKNLSQNTSVHSLYHAFSDIKYLLNNKPDFNWNVVKSDVIKTKTELPFLITVKLLNSISGNFIPELSGINYNESGNICIYNGFYLSKLREISHGLSFSDIISGKISVFHYLKFRIKYFLYKRRFIKLNPMLTKLILNRQKDILCKH